MLFLGILLVIELVFANADNNLNEFPKCRFKDSELTKCIIKAVNGLRPEFRTGDKKMKIPSLNPFIIPTFSVAQELPMTNYTATVWKFAVLGMDSYDIKELSFDHKTTSFRIRTEFQPVNVTTDYEVVGELVSVPIRGRGVCHVFFGASNATMEVHGKMVRYRGGKLYNPTDLRITLDIDDVTVDFHGLFDNNKELERRTNRILNENSKLLLETVMPILEDIAENALLKPVKSVLRRMLYV